MGYHRPTSWREAVQLLARSRLTVLAGGTALLRRSGGAGSGVLDLSAIDGYRDHALEGGAHVLAAGVPVAAVVRSLGGTVPAVARAALGVGGPEIRRRATVGGGVAAAEPLGDLAPALIAVGATIDVVSAVRRRTLSVADYLGQPRGARLQPDELIRSITVPLAAGPQEFIKVARRAGNVGAVCNFAIAVDPIANTVRTGVGRGGAQPCPAVDAEAFVLERLGGPRSWCSAEPLPEAVVHEFGVLVAGASDFGDLHASARYRRHAIAVIASRGLRTVWTAQAAAADRSAR